MRNAIVLFLLLFFTTAAVAQKRVTIGGGGPDESKDWPKPELRAGLTPQQTAAAIAAYAQKLFDTDHFSGVVLAAHGDEVLLERAWGLADKASNTPNTIDTKFNIGSINKTFTQSAIRQLKDAGRLSLDDTVRKYLPDYPSPAADKITIRHLFEHKSGLGDFFGPKYMAAPPAKLRELSDFLPLFADAPLQFEPGTSQRYSNAGYVVLGLIIERVSGEKYRDYVRKHIFDAAGMKESGFWAVDEKVAKRATGYTKRGPEGPLPERKPNTDTLPGRPSSAGGAYTTARDLLRFFQWRHENGIGVGGGAPGLNASVEIDNGWTVIAMANYDPPAAEALTRGAMAIVRGRAEEQEQTMRRAPTAPQKTELTGTVTVPLTESQHLFAVEAMIDGKGPFRFVIDSGAAGMMRVSKKLADALSLEQIGEALSGDPSGRNTVRTPVVRVGSVDIGKAHFAGVDATVSDPLSRDDAPDGVVGLGLFGELTATVDGPKHELRLSRDALPAPGAHVVAFTMNHGVPQIDVDAAGARFKADVDLGSPAMLSVPPSIVLPFKSAPVVAAQGRTTANEFEIKRADLDGDLRVAGHVVTNASIDVVDLFPVANVGSRFLRKHAVTFDMPNHRLAIE